MKDDSWKMSDYESCLLQALQRAQRDKVKVQTGFGDAQVCSGAKSAQEHLGTKSSEPK
jgi:hypothetical protein